MKLTSGRLTCFFVVCRFSVVVVIFSLFLQSFALHNVQLPSRSRFPSNRRTWRYQPSQYSRTLSPARLERFRQRANPRRLAERRPVIDTTRRFRQLDRTRGLRRKQTPRLSSVHRTPLSQSRGMNSRTQSQVVSKSNSVFSPRTSSKGIRKGRFSVASPQNKVFHIRLNKHRGNNQVTPRSRAPGPLVYNNKPAYSPLVRSRTLAPKPSPKLVHRKENRQNSERSNKNRIGNFVVDLTKGPQTVSPDKPIILTNNVMSQPRINGPLILAQGRFKIKKKMPTPPLVRPIVLPKPVTITQTPETSHGLNPHFVKSMPKISNIVPVPKLAKVPTILIKPKTVIIHENKLSSKPINKQTNIPFSSPIEPLIKSRNGKKGPLFVLVKKHDGQFSNSIIKIQRNEGDKLQQEGSSPTLVEPNSYKPFDRQNIPSDLGQKTQQINIKVLEKPFKAITSEMVDKQTVFVTNHDIPTLENQAKSKIEHASNSEILVPNNLEVKQTGQSIVTQIQNGTIGLHDIANFINQIKSGEVNSLDIPATVKTSVSSKFINQNIDTGVEKMAHQSTKLNNVSKLENKNQRPIDNHGENLGIIRDFVDQLKVATYPLGKSQHAIDSGIINPTIQSGLSNQQVGLTGLVNPMLRAGLMNPYIPGLQTHLNSMAVSGWDGSSSNVPLVMQQAGITHGSQLSAAMQEMLFGDSVDPPDPTASGVEVEIEDIPTTVKPKRNKRRRRKKNRRQRMRFRPTTEMPFVHTTTYSSFDFSGFEHTVIMPKSSPPSSTTTTMASVPTTLLPSTESANDVAISLARRLIALVNKGDSAASDVLKSLNVDFPQFETTVTPVKEVKDKSLIPVDVSANEEKSAYSNESSPIKDTQEENTSHLDPEPPIETIMEPVSISSENIENIQNIKDSIISDMSLPGDFSVDSLSMSSFLSTNDIGGVKIEKIQTDQKASLEDESLPPAEPAIQSDSEFFTENKNIEQINKAVVSKEDFSPLATTEQPFESMTLDLKDKVKNIDSPEEIPTIATTQQSFESIDFNEILRKKLQRQEDEPLIAGLISIFNNFDPPSKIIRNIKSDFVTYPLTEMPTTTTTTTTVPTTELRTTKMVRTTQPPTTAKVKRQTTITNMLTVPVNENLRQTVLPKPSSDDSVKRTSTTQVSEDTTPKSPLEMLVGLLSELKSAIIPKSVEVPMISLTTTTTTQAPVTQSPSTTQSTTTTIAPSTSMAMSRRPGCTPFHPGFQCRGKEFFSSIPSTGKWCVDTCRQKGCVKKVCDCNCNRRPPPNRLRSRLNQNWGRQNNWQNKRHIRRRGRNMRRKKPKTTTKEPPEEIEAEDMPSTTTTEMMATTEYYGFYSDNSQTTPGYYSGNENSDNRGAHGEFLSQLDWASDPNLDVSRFSGRDHTGTTISPNSEWMSPSRPPPSWRGTAWELPPAPIKKKKQNSEGEEGTTKSPGEWTSQPTGWSSGSDRSWGRESNWQQGGWNQPPQNRWNNGPRFNGASRDTWREPIGNFRGDSGHGSWNDPPPISESGDQWRRNMFGIRRSMDSGFRLRNSWRSSKSKKNSGSGGEEQEPGET